MICRCRGFQKKQALSDMIIKSCEQRDHVTQAISKHSVALTSPLPPTITTTTTTHHHDHYHDATDDDDPMATNLDFQWYFFLLLFFTLLTIIYASAIAINSNSDNNCITATTHHCSIKPRRQGMGLESCTRLGPQGIFFFVLCIFFLCFIN